MILATFAIVHVAFGEAQSDEFPAVVSTTTPSIPPIALAARLRGNVVVDVTIDPEGSAISARAIEGHPILQRTTEEAVMQWRFARAMEPARTIRLTFIYPEISYGGSPSITVRPYRIELKVALPEYLKPPQTISQIPADWRRGTDRCGIHGVVLKKGRVEILYGLLGFRKGYHDAQEKLFPNGNTEVYGGCVIMTDAVTGERTPKFADVLYCVKCRLAQKKWSNRNRHRKFSI